MADSVLVFRLGRRPAGSRFFCSSSIWAPVKQLRTVCWEGPANLAVFVSRSALKVSLFNYGKVGNILSFS